MWKLRDESERLELERSVELMRRYYAATMIQSRARRWLAAHGEYVVV